jgi:hypothetical protein
MPAGRLRAAPDVIAVSDVGWRAEAAVARAPHGIQVLAALSTSVYLTIADEIVWLGPPGAPLHPRAMLTTGPLPAGGRLRITLRAARRWRPPPLPDRADASTALRSNVRVLLPAVAELGVPDGFGALLVGRVPAFPLESAAPAARALARACASDDAGAAMRAAMPLLGLGPGLTPAGDDYVGGAFFARALVERLEHRPARDWRRAADRIRRQGPVRTHPISAALLGDLLDGDGHAPLHDLACGLVGRRPCTEILEAARQLTRIGHSSGWDMLTGFVGGLGQLADM